MHRCRIPRLAAALLVALCACRATPPPDTGLYLCAVCGHLKDSPECCMALYPRCAVCGLYELSPGHCTGLLDHGDLALCPECGQPAGSEACCDPAAPVCAACGYQLGSLLCCRRWPAGERIAL